MSLKRYAVRFTVLVSAFMSGILAVAIYPFQLSGPNVTIETFDRSYACGDCYVRFGISKIDGTEEDNKQATPGRFNGWDVLVRFKGNESYLSGYQEELFAKDKNCARPTFRLKGQFKRRLIYAFLYDGDRYDGIYFDANSGVAVSEDSNCAQLLMDIPLS